MAAPTCVRWVFSCSCVCFVLFAVPRAEVYFEDGVTWSSVLWGLWVRGETSFQEKFVRDHMGPLPACPPGVPDWRRRQRRWVKKRQIYEVTFDDVELMAYLKGKSWDGEGGGCGGGMIPGSRTVGGGPREHGP